MPFRKMARHFGDTPPSHCSPTSDDNNTTSDDGQTDGHMRPSSRRHGCSSPRAMRSPTRRALPAGTLPVVSRYPPYVPSEPCAPRAAPPLPVLPSYASLLTQSTVTYEDIKSLKNDWLTDNNIAFWEEWLEREILPKYPQARIVLLRPSMTFLLMKEPDMRQIRSALPDFRKVTHIFLPINDARNVAQAEGGSHWSLLLVSAIDGVAFHYDSLGGANFAEGRLATHKMSEILGRPLRYLNLDDAPQQENGSDCGVFVCILMRHLLVKRLLSANAREKVSMSMANKLIDSHGGRKEMLKIIESLRKEGERRRS
nr:Ulp1 protease family protein [Colletotrichum truncatum]KAF6793110.1 Ulp1 protease family protein [Colletotrichum truncatum]